MLTNQIKMNVRVLNDMIRFPLRYSKNLFMFASVGKDRQTVFFCEIMNYLFAKLLAKRRQYVLAGKSLRMNQFSDIFASSFVLLQHDNVMNFKIEYFSYIPKSKKQIEVRIISTLLCNEFNYKVNS